MLIGQYTKKAAEMQNEVIDLPDNVEVSITLTKLQFCNNNIIRHNKLDNVHTDHLHWLHNS